MAKHRDRRHPELMPHPIGHTLRALARWAVAASLGVPAACADRHGAEDLRHPVPSAGRVAQTAAGAEGPATPADAAPRADSAPPSPDADGGGPAEEDAGPQVAADAGPQDAGAPGAWQPIECHKFAVQFFDPPIQTTRPIDYFGLYRMRPQRYGPMVEPADVYLQDSMGTPCSTSSDVAACNERVKALVVPSEECKTPAKSECTSFGVTTAGDRVERIDSNADLLALLGTIDSPSKAAIFAFWEEMVIACRRDDMDGTQIAHPGNWKVQSVFTTCPSLYERTLEFDAAGNVISNETRKVRDLGCSTGRRPAGLRPALAGADAGSPIGAYFAGLARLEAASVCAFERIAGELRAFAAPARLVAAAEAAARDEVRHARAMALLALRFGADSVAPQIDPQPLRSRFEFALDNAREGCVRETFGALLAHHQAALAGDPAVGASMARIAEDETRHAELAWRIAAWLEPQLPAAEQVSLRAARSRELQQLACDLGGSELSERERIAVGLPSSAVAQSLLAHLALLLPIVRRPSLVPRRPAVSRSP